MRDRTGGEKQSEFISSHVHRIYIMKDRKKENISFFFSLVLT